MLENGIREEVIHGGNIEELMNLLINNENVIIQLSLKYGYTAKFRPFKTNIWDGMAGKVSDQAFLISLNMGSIDLTFVATFNLANIPNLIVKFIIF